MFQTYQARLTMVAAAVSDLKNSNYYSQPASQPVSQQGLLQGKRGENWIRCRLIFSTDCAPVFPPFR